MTALDENAVAPASTGRGHLTRDLTGAAIIALFAIAGYLLFPNNLALLTRIIAIRCWCCRLIS